MKTGDLVRFWFVGFADGKDEAPKQVIGVLIEYHTWEKVGTVLYDGKIFRIRAENLEKAGKKDAIK